MTACTKAAPPVSTTSTPTHNNQSITSPPLTVAQQIKLQWHQRLNHVNFPQLTTWMRLGHLKVPQGVINAPNPVCSACQFGKAKRRSHTCLLYTSDAADDN
ncbi:MAG: GAG-pre-integrase domain-containing protein, partial [bacterium]